jgi:hypothetical protein
MSSFNGARTARRRTRAATTIAAALLASAAFSAVPAGAAVVPSAVDPNTTLPNSFTDANGLELVLCTNSGCAGVRPDLGNATAVPGNFNAGGEAFWYLNEAVMPSGALAEFAVEGAFEDLAPNQGGAFTRQRFRFDDLTGTIRVTTPYGVRIYDDLGGGIRTINDTVDLGLVGGCGTPPAGTFCDYAGANYGNELTHFLVPEGFTPGAPGSVTVHSGRVVGSPTGFNGVKVERQTGTDPITGEPIWELVEQTDTFNVEFQIASAPAAPVVYSSISTRTVDFLPRRSDEASGVKKVRVKNDGAAPMTISDVSLSGANAGSFTASGCVGTLPPGANCDVTVGFTATSGVGSHEALLTITNDSINAPSLTVGLSATITGLPTAAAPAGTGTGATTTNTIVQVVPGAGAALPSTAVLGATARSLAVGRLSLSNRISRARLRAQGLRASMNLQEGTQVVRIAVYRARNGRKTGSALLVTNRLPNRAGLFRVSLRNSSLLRKLRPGSYVIEVRAGQSAATLGGISSKTFRVVR